MLVISRYMTFDLVHREEGQLEASMIINNDNYNYLDETIR